MQIIFLKLKSRIFNLQLRQKKVMYTICPCFLHKNYPFFQFLLFLLSCYVQYQSSANYSSTLAHKINHSFKPNCDWVHSVHPCYGRIPAVQTIQVVYTFIHLGSFMHSFILTFWQFRHLYSHGSLDISIYPFILVVTAFKFAFILFTYHPSFFITFIRSLFFLLTFIHT